MGSNQPTLPSPDEAYRTLHQNVFSRVLFGKLANDYGIAPQNGKEAQELLTLAASLVDMNNEGQIKRASETTSRFSPAVAGFSKVAEAVNGTTTTANYLSQAVSGLMQSPEIYNSVLSLKAAQAEAERYSE